MLDENQSHSEISREPGKVLASLLSILFDSSVIAVPVFLGVAWAETGDLLAALGWATLALLFAVGVPLAYISLGRRMGRISGFDLPRRQERMPFIAVNLIGNGLGFLLLRALGAPQSLADLLLIYVALGITMFSISNFWKISLHAGGVGGFAAFLTWTFGPAWAFSFLAIPIVGWARVYRRRHTWAQVWLGALVGASVTLVVLATLR